MNETPTTQETTATVPTREETLRKITIFDYVLHLLSPFTLMLLSVVALIINYVKRPDAVGTVFSTHMDWMIRTCWWTVFWLVLTWVVAIVTFGLMGWLTVIPVLWYMYRMIKGLLRAMESRPIE